MTRLDKRVNCPITIGYDAEFVLQGVDKTFVPALMHISDPDKNGRIGLDGITDIGEIRGDFSTNVNDIIEDIRNNLRSAPPGVRMLRIVAGAYPSGHPIGCHIHFGTMGYYFRTSIQSTVGLLLTLIEPVGDAEKRFWSAPPNCSGHYGDLNFFATKPYGVEYKMPWSFIVNPDDAKTIFHFAQIMALFCGDIEFGGLGCIFQAADLYTTPLDSIHRNREREAMKRFFTESLIPGLLDGEQQIIEALQSPDRGKTAVWDGFTWEELETLNRVAGMVTNDYRCNADVDLRKTWAKDEKCSLIYGRDIYPTVQTNPSLNPVYVYNSFTDRILLGQFPERARQAVEIITDRLELLRPSLVTMNSYNRDCPSIGIPAGLAMTATSDILNAVISNLEDSN